MDDIDKQQINDHDDDHNKEDPSTSSPPPPPTPVVAAVSTIISFFICWIYSIDNDYLRLCILMQVHLKGIDSLLSREK
jgi:hypothetical protein